MKTGKYARLILATVLLSFSVTGVLADVNIDVDAKQSLQQSFDHDFLCGMQFYLSSHIQTEVAANALRKYAPQLGVKFIKLWDPQNTIFTGTQPSDITNSACYKWDKIDDIILACKENNIKIMWTCAVFPEVLLDPNHKALDDPPADENLDYLEEYIYRIMKHITGTGYDPDAGNCLGYQVDYVNIGNEINGQVAWNTNSLWTKDRLNKVYDYAVHGITRADNNIKVGGFMTAPMGPPSPTCYVDW
ncbi:MAG: hypothetical protein NT011_07370 [Kiritimatiellaeota bacterium]|nr:hypothetical protein [Kiritimatiellota bacterium]